MFQFRDYQHAAVEDARRCFAKGDRRILLVAPTGAGKTVIAAMFAKLAVEKDRRVLFLAHRRELVKQCESKLISFGVEPGVIMAGEDIQLDYEVQVASIDTLRARAMSTDRMPMPRADVVMIDEAHRSLAPTYLQLIEAYPDAAIIGLTATPVRGDGKGLGHVYDDMVLCPSVGELTESGYLVPARYFAPTIPDLTGVKIVRGDYDAKQLEAAMDKREPVGDVIENWGRICPDRPTIVFASGVKHSIHLCEEFQRAGVRAVHVDGNMTTLERDAAINGLRTGRYQVVTNCMVLCLDTETEILTDKGWTSYGEMTPAHKVANWDQGRVWFEEPLDIVVRDRQPDEKMFSIETPKKSIRVTSRHRMLYRTKRGGKFLKCPVDELEGRSVELPVVGRADIPDANVTLSQCMFAGFFVGDGSKAKLRRGGVEYVVSQSLVYPKIIEWFDGVVERAGLHCVRYERGGSVPHIRWSFCRGTGGKSQKREGGVAGIEWLMDKNCVGVHALSAEQFEAFMQGLWMADGNHGDGVAHVARKHITSCNRAMLDNLQAAAVVRGIRASLSAEIHGRKDGHRAQWNLSFGKRDTCFTAGAPFKAESVWVPEKVWCVKTTARNIITRRRGKVVVMGNTEGFDMPELSCCVLVRPTKNIGLYLQMAGRVLRPSHGKSDTIIIDHSGNVYEHGFVADDHGWQLDENMPMRPKLERDRVRKEAKQITCVKCAHIYSGSPVCPSCGHVPRVRGEAIETRHAVLTEVEGRKTAKKKQYSMEEKQRWYQMLKHYARSKGKKDAWIAHTYKAKFDVWPNPIDKNAPPIEPNIEVSGFIRHRNIAYARRKTAEVDARKKGARSAHRAMEVKV